jgi:hypothetical protein
MRMGLTLQMREEQHLQATWKTLFLAWSCITQLTVGEQTANGQSLLDSMKMHQVRSNGTWH